MSVSYRGLKPVMCIQELDHFGYIPLLVSLKPYSLSPCVCVCVCVKILNIFKIKTFFPLSLYVCVLKYLVFLKEKIVS